MAVSHMLGWGFGGGLLALGIGYIMEISTLKQLGALAMLLALVLTPILLLAPERQAKILELGKRCLIGLGIAAVVSFATAELALRIWFWKGETFGSHFGPIVARFERDFSFNRFDGPSRGPETAGPKPPKMLRVLVQGDSFTWGQGVKREENLYSTRLLQMLRKDRPDTEMAVLAKGGRDIDRHLLQIAKWGREIDPDIIIYQWYYNDLDFEKKRRSIRQGHVWQRAFFHRKFMESSYFWFFLNYKIYRIWPKDGSNFEEYIERKFTADTPEWRRFASVFGAWSREAKRLTPNVLVALYPRIESNGKPGLLAVYSRFKALCEEQNVEVSELWHGLSDLKGDPARFWASPYDGHPGEEIHERIAEALYETLKKKFLDGQMRNTMRKDVEEH